MHFSILFLSFLIAMGETTFSQIIVAHRGGPGADRQESSIEAFAYSISQNVKILESDIHLTKDNEIVLYHDPYLFHDKKLVISDLTFDEAVQICKSKNFDLVSLKRLAEFLKTQDESIRLELEIKHRMSDQIPHNFYKRKKETVEIVLQTIQQLDLLSRVTISSFNEDILKLIRSKIPAVPLKYLYRGTYFGHLFGNIGKCKNYCFLPNWGGALKFVKKYRIEALAPSSLLFLHPLAQKISSIPAILKKRFPEERPFQLSLWTVNDPKELDQLKMIVPIDDVITDYPERFRE